MTEGTQPQQAQPPQRRYLIDIVNTPLEELTAAEREQALRYLAYQEAANRQLEESQARIAEDALAKAEAAGASAARHTERLAERLEQSLTDLLDAIRNTTGGTRG